MARPYRLIIWGPGEVGGATLRAAHARDDFEIVGVKVFSPRKQGKDAGELVGIGPIGVAATRSKAEIRALDADCVIVTPQPRAVLEGLDDDVIGLLESGKSVVSTAAYHDVAMPNWFNRARSPTARLREIARTPGSAARTWERVALWLVRVMTSIRALDPITDFLFRPIANRRVPARASADRLLEACRTGKSSLHGTGVHPTYMVERQIMRLCHAMSRVSHLRFVEAFDFSRAPEGMWGGLQFFGFGRDPKELGDDWVVAKAGDFYYGDLTGNVAHALYGAKPDAVRLERSLRGIPAVKDMQVGSTRIAAGTTATLHMTHRGYLGDHCFFTNEEIWYLGAENAYHGDNVPFGRIPPHGGYTFEITGQPATIRGQISSPVIRSDTSHPITIMSVNALLDAVGPVCSARPGIIIDDARPYYRHDEGAAPAATAAVVAPEPVERRDRRDRRDRRPYRVAIWGRGDMAAAVLEAARAKAELEVIEIASRQPQDLLAAEIDCVVVTRDLLVAASEVDALLIALLESGKDVVSAAADGLPTSRLRDACRRGGAAIHRVDFLATLMLQRMVMTMVRGLSAVRRIRIVEALDLSTTAERRSEAAALGLGEAVTGGDAAAGNGATDAALAHAIEIVARDLYGAAAAADVRVERTIQRITSTTGTTTALCITHRGSLGDRELLTSEAWRYLGAEHAYRGDDLPHGGFRSSTSYAIQIDADPANLEAQWELEPSGAADPVTQGCARMILDAIGPVCEAAPGIVLEDARPRYQHDDRVTGNADPA